VIEELTDIEAAEAIPLNVAPEPSSSAQLATGTGLGDSAIVPESSIHLELFSPRSAGDNRTSESSVNQAASVRGSHLAEIFHRIWTNRAAGSVIQVQLEDGQTLTVTKFHSVPQNETEYAAFIVDDSALGAGLVIVPWRSIRMIHVGSVKDFPKQLFG
jgi:hypothetical protein